ncbi:hypothetical protein ACLB2K_026726 [Fragaria x ananassa]
MEAALLDALKMPSLAPEVVAAKDLLKIKHLEDLEFRLDQIPNLQDNLQQKEHIASECLHRQTTLEENFMSEKEQLDSQHNCILSEINAEIKSLVKQRANIEARIAAAKQRKAQHVQAIKTKIPELEKLKEETLVAAQASKQARDDTEASQTHLKRTLLDIHVIPRKFDISF